MTYSDPFRVDPDVARAETPPGRAYGDPALHARILERAFAPSWQWIAGDAPARGSATPVTYLAGALDEPLLRTVDADGREWLGSNVCTHRGYLVCRAAGPVKELRCGYHGRAFDLRGRLLRAPGFEGACDFPRPADDLPSLALERLGPLTFTSLATRDDFARWIAPAAERFGWCPWANLRADPSGTRSFEVAANWALYVENYLEGLHIPWVHPGLRESIVTGTYRTETTPLGVLQLADAPADEPALEAPPGSADAGARLAGVYLWLFPNLMLNLYPWGLSLNRVVPLGPAATRVDYARWIWEEAHLDRGAGGDLDTVEREDEEVVEGVQRGVRARLYGRGRYAPAHERGTHRFHRLLADALGAG